MIDMRTACVFFFVFIAASVGRLSAAEACSWGPVPDEQVPSIIYEGLYSWDVIANGTIRSVGNPADRIRACVEMSKQDSLFCAENRDRPICDEISNRYEKECVAIGIATFSATTAWKGNVGEQVTFRYSMDEVCGPAYNPQAGQEATFCGNYDRFGQLIAHPCSGLYAHSEAMTNYRARWQALLEKARNSSDDVVNQVNLATFLEDWGGRSRCT